MKERNKKVTNSKAKGRRLQNAVRDLIKETFCLDDDDIRCAVGYEQGTDLKFNEETQALLGIGVEIKNQMNLNIWSSLAQAERNCPDGCQPVLIFHRPIQGNSRIWITMDVKHYLEIRKKEIDKEIG